MADEAKRDRTADKNWDNEVPLEKKLDDLYALIDGIEVAMFTTRRADGQLVSRPMQVQRRTRGTDMWFMTNVASHKLEELATDPSVNLAFYKDRTREWVSVSGTAVLSQDKSLIHDLYQPDWRAWLGDEGGERDGGPDDPRIALVLIEAHVGRLLEAEQADAARAVRGRERRRHRVAAEGLGHALAGSGRDRSRAGERTEVARARAVSRGLEHFQPPRRLGIFRLLPHPWRADRWPMASRPMR